MIQRVREWWRTPLVIPRWMLTAKYLGFIGLGALAFTSGSPSISETTPGWYLPVWSPLVMLAATIAAVASVLERGETLEQWAALALASLLTVYSASAIIQAVAEADSGAALFAAVVVLVTLLPAVRAGALIRGTGTR